MTNQVAGIDPEKYKNATRDQWNKSGAGYNAWGHVVDDLIRGGKDWMIEMTGITEGSRVLELAAGGGLLSLSLARQVGPQGSVLATDLAPEILAFTAQNAQAAGLSNVETREMDGEEVDVPEGSFDAVVSSLGLMFFPNPLKSLQGQMRALRPGGKVAALVFSTPDKNPFFSLPAKIIRERANLPMPQPGMPGPFALGAPGLLADLFSKAGLRDVTSETMTTGVKLPSADEHLRLLRDAFGALHMMMTGMDDAEKQATWAAVREAMQPFQGADGFQSPAEIIVCAGTR